MAEVAAESGICSNEWSGKEYLPGVTLLTATGARPEAFELCKMFIRRQTWNGPLQWIVVDDFPPEPAAGVSERQELVWLRDPCWSVTVLQPVPRWRPGKNTQARNLLAGIPEIRYDRVMVWEDDDWYAPDYIASMVSLLEQKNAVGEAPARYYNVASRAWMEFHNASHASLCATAFRAVLIQRFALACTMASGQFIDIKFWEGGIPNSALVPTRRCVGIKGMPGRGGIGMGHHPINWPRDPDLSVLRAWVGEEAELYRKYAR